MLAEEKYVSPDEQEILNAPPEKLMLMLYDGAIGFTNESIMAIGEDDIVKAHNANMRIQRIINELMATLDMQYELSVHLMSVYTYLEQRLQSAKDNNDINALKEVRELISELRDTWAQALPNK